MKFVTALFSLVFLAFPARALTYDIGTDGYIYASGNVESDEADRFVAFLKTHPILEGTRVVFNSGGGMVQGGVEMGKVIEEHHFSTDVAEDGYCASICVVMWASGKEKFVEARAKVGVHMASDGGGSISAEESRQLHSVTEGIIEILAAHGCPESVQQTMRFTPPSNIYWLSEEELKAWGVANPPPSITVDG